MDGFILQYKELLIDFAELAANTLDFIGILIIVIGSVRALVHLVRSFTKKRPFHVVFELGKALSFALEFKMGAEIVKTVIIHDLQELAILGIVIILRALLALIIHWEICADEKETALRENRSEEGKAEK